VSYALFLDDQRNPKDAWIYPRRGDNNILIDNNSLEQTSGIPNGIWEIVRNYDEFVAKIEESGVPRIVSFDHDLDESAVRHYMNEARITGFIDYFKIKEKTGLHCASYLIDRCLKTNTQFPHYFIHSANTIGTENIKNEIEEFLQRYPQLRNAQN
jgi:hypothetical protein